MIVMFVDFWLKYAQIANADVNKIKISCGAIDEQVECLSRIL